MVMMVYFLLKLGQMKDFASNMMVKLVLELLVLMVNYTFLLEHLVIVVFILRQMRTIMPRETIHLSSSKMMEVMKMLLFGVEMLVVLMIIV